MDNDNQSSFLTRQLQSSCLQVVRRSIRKQVPSLLDGFLLAVLDKLTEFSREDGDVDTEHEYYYSHARLSLSRDHIEQTFLRYMLSTLDQFLEAGVAPSEDLLSGAEGLSLVDDDELEERVAIVAIRQRTESSFQEPLWALNAYMSLLGRRQPVETENNPLAPIRFCLALREALADIELSRNAKTIVYKLFERRFMNELGGLYRQLNRRLNDVGLNANLTFGVVKSREGVLPPQGVIPADGGAGWLTGRRITGIAQRVDDNYLHNHYPSTREPDDRRGYRQGEFYSKADIYAAILDIQRQQLARFRSMSDDTGSVALQSLSSEALYAQLAQLFGSSKQLHLQDLQAFEQVETLFKNICNDDSIGYPVKALLSYLHAPLLKLSSADTDFFCQREHPARQLLSRFVEASMMWLAADGSSPFGVYERIKESIDRLLNDMSGEVRPFTEELLSFNGFIKQLELRVKLMEQQATEEAQAESQVLEAKLRVHEELNWRIADRQLPSAILMFLLQPWFDYLSNVLTRMGSDSEHWREALALVDDLLWGLELSGQDDERQRWSQHYPWIESMIQKGFEAIEYDEGRQRKMTLDINRVYQRKLQDLEIQSAPESVRSRLIRLAKRNAGVKSGSHFSESEQQHLEQLKAAPFGTCFEFKSGHREKLIWHNLRTMQFLFVDQRNHRSVMRTGHDVVRLMMDGTMWIVDVAERPLADSPLEQYFDDLKSASSDQ